MKIEKILLVLFAGCLIFTNSALGSVKYQRISLEEYRNKMMGGWLGQIAGVCWGAPTEFHCCGWIMGKDKVPQWKPEMINNAFGQDDIYVEMTFLRTLEEYGLDVSIEQAGIDFANSKYLLWHANQAGRENLRSGIAPPDSGHPKFNSHADDIDYQIEADYAGLISPGLPSSGIDLGEKFGRLMNYGDGLYGGQFVAAMYSYAFFESDPEKLVRLGMQAIPSGSTYHECISDTLKWYKENPDDWQKTWKLINKKYHENPEYRKFSCNREKFLKEKDGFNIDAKINGAYIAMGLLYGKGDFDQTTIISMRCGQDSDCNPSNAAGILGAVIGFKGMDEKFREKLDNKTKFDYTEYNFPDLVNVCEKLARQIVVRYGGKVEKDWFGNEYFLIPVIEPVPSKLESCANPGAIANSKFTAEQLEKMNEFAVKLDIEKFAPGWKVRKCGDYMNPGVYEEALGRKNVLLTHPMTEKRCCVISKKVKVEQGKKTTLKLVVGHHPKGDWKLVVKADDDVLLQKDINKKVTKDNFVNVDVDLSGYAGKTIGLELKNCAIGWYFEGGYWDRIQVLAE